MLHHLSFGILFAFRLQTSGSDGFNQNRQGLSGWGVLFPVEMGWVPIHIAPVVGAALKVFSKCLTMEESYRFIEWKGVFLITGMLPPEQTGAAEMIAEDEVDLAGLL